MNIFNPEVIVIGGGLIAAGELLSARAGEIERRALPLPARPRAHQRPLRPRAGLIGAATLAFDELERPLFGRGGRAGSSSADPDREPRGLTLRVLSALREADVVACEDTRRTRKLLDRYGVKALARLLPRARRALACRASWWSGCGTGAVVALVSDAGDAGDLGIPASSSCGRRRRRAPGRGAPGAVGGAGRAGGERAAGRRVALRGVPAAQAGRARRGCSRPAGDAWWRSSPRGGWRLRWRCWRRSTPSGRSRSRAS